MMTTTQLVNYAQAHSFPAWSDDDQTIHVVLPWVRRDDDGALVTGYEVASVPATITDVRSLISR
jgi:hypothetical protein